MAYSPKQWRAIRLYIAKNKVRPQLSAFPYLRFITEGGEEQKVHISSLEDLYTAHQEQEKRQKAADRRLEKKSK